MVDHSQKAGSQYRAPATNACVAAAQPYAEPADLVPAMVTAAAAVLEDFFECSPGTAAIAAEDALRAAYQSKNASPQNASPSLPGQNILPLPVLPSESLRPLYPPDA